MVTLLSQLIDFGCGVLSILIIFAMICHAVIKTLRRGMRRCETIMIFLFTILLFITAEYSLNDSRSMIMGSGIIILWVVYLIGLIFFLNKINNK